MTVIKDEGRPSTNVLNTITTTTAKSAAPRRQCYRHRPDLKKHTTDSASLQDVQRQTECLPTSDRAAITHIWSLFSAAPADQRTLILKGLLSTCCMPQLSFLYDEIKPLLRIDFSFILPREISLRIFSYLDAKSLCHAAQVSRSWRSLADDNSLWHQMCEQHINKVCAKCGWGLPLMDMPRKRRQQQNHETILSATGDANAKDSIHTMKRLRINEDDVDERGHRQQQKLNWKNIYSERLVVERNWRGLNCRTQVLPGHTDGVMCLQYCESSNVLITGSADRTVRVWDLTKGQEVRQMTGHTRSVRALQFDSWKLVTGSLDHTLRIWDWHTGRCIRTLEGHTGGVTALHFSCRLLASGSTDHTIRVWNFEAGECCALTGHTGLVSSVRINHANGSELVSASSDETIRIWSLQSRTCIRVLKGHVGPIQSALLTPPRFKHRIQQQQCRPDAVDDVMMDHHDEDQRQAHNPLILSASLDNTIKFWDPQYGTCVRTLFGHQEGVLSLALDSLRVVSGSQDRTVRVWDMKSGNWMYALQGHSRPVTAVAISDTKIISASDDGEVRVWDFGFVSPHQV